jgi:hypothetical protein
VEKRRLIEDDDRICNRAPRNHQSRETPYSDQGFRPIAEYWRSPYGLETRKGLMDAKQLKYKDRSQYVYEGPLGEVVHDGRSFFA